jgi:hypothetical protein
LSSAFARPEIDVSAPPRPPRAPYPGLRPFRTDESDIFFGREHQTDELLEKLQRHRFIAVTGPSGCGKSSLIKAGVIPALHAGFMAEAGARWRVVQMRPGEQPMKSLATALAVPAILGAEQDPAESRAYVEAALRFGPLGLTEIVNESPVFRNANLFLLVDQFEEIFRFRERIDRDEADAFVRLLLETTARPGVPAFIVITMRSDYLGDCAIFHGLPEAINDSQYLTPRLTREECGSAIVGPARVFRGEVEPALVNRLLNDFGPDPDRLPLLQHALMRMWQLKLPLAKDSAPRFTLTIDDYAAVGGLAEALSKHADEALAELTPEQRRIAEILFRRLTERGRGRRDTRAPARLGEVADVAQVDATEVAHIVEAFRGEGRNFVTPADGPLERDTLLDIGHESLIRQWGTLTAWVEAEAESAATYLRLVDTAHRGRKGAAAPLWGPDLELTLAWEAKERPTKPWAKRYGSESDFDEAIAFLRASQREWDEVQARKAKRVAEERQREIDRARADAEHDRLEAEAKAAKAEAGLVLAEVVAERRLRRSRLLIGSVAILLVAVLGMGGWIWYRGYMATPVEETFVSWVKVNGVPKGIGKLTPEQAARRAVSIIITRNGRGKDARVVRMRTVDALGRPTAAHSIGTYLTDASDTPESHKEVAWEFIYDQNGRIAYEVAFDKRNRQVRSVVYSPADKESSERTAQFFGSDGLPQRELNNCASSVTIDYSKEGYERLFRFRDRIGNPVPGRDHAIVQERRYDGSGNLVEMISLDRSGKWMNDRAGNAALKMSDFDPFGNARRFDALDRRGALTTVKGGWASRLATYDEAGNELEVRYLDVDGRPIAIDEGWHRSASRYGDGGQLVSASYWAPDDTPALQKDLCHEWRMEWDKNGRRSSATCIGRDGKPSPGQLGAPTWRNEYDKDDNPISTSYFDSEGRPTTSSSGWHRVERSFDDHGNILSYSYLDIERKPARHGSGHAIARHEYKANREVRRQYLDLDGKPMHLADGYAEVLYEYDENGNRTRQKYFGVDGKTPVLHKQGNSGVNYAFDSCGRQTERWFVDPDGKRVPIEFGYAGVRISYEPALGLAVGIEYLNADGRLTLSSEGIAGYADTLDKFGNVIEHRYFGLDRKPATLTDGSAGWRASYDSRGHRTSVEYIDAAGRLAVGSASRQEQYARRTFVNDPLGRIMEEAYFGPAGEPIYVGNGFAKVRYAFDDNGLNVEQAYFGTTGEPTVTSLGCHRLRWAHDERGQRTEERCFGLDGQPKSSTNGFHRLVWTRDLHGRVIGERDFAVDGSPVLGPGGWHYRLTERDEYGRSMRESAFERDGAKTTFEEAGHHVHVRKRDARGYLIEEQYLDTRGQLVSGDAGHATKRNKIDRLGREVGVEFRDRKQSLTPGPQGYARAVRTYDDRGRLVLETFWSDSGAAIDSRRGGYAQRAIAYEGNRQIERFLRATGAPGVDGKKFAVRITTRNAQGDEIEKAHFDPRGTPVTGDSWWFRETTEYDSLRRVVGFSVYIPDTADVQHGALNLSLKRRRDERGRVVEETYLDSQRNPTVAVDTYARVRYRHDAVGNVVESSFFGADNRPVNRRDGASRVVQRFDEQRRTVEERTFDKDDQPVGRSQSPAEVVRYSYDRRGNQTSERYFNASMKPVAVTSKSGSCFGLLWSHDIYGRRQPSEGICLDQQGRLAQR